MRSDNALSLHLEALARERKAEAEPKIEVGVDWAKGKSFSMIDLINKELFRLATAPKVGQRLRIRLPDFKSRMTDETSST